MKKLALLASAAGLIFVGAASAQDADLEIELKGNVIEKCEAVDFQGTSLELDFGQLDEIAKGSVSQKKKENVSIICNSPNSFQVIVRSRNGGFLFREGTDGGLGNQVAYTVEARDGSGLEIPITQLSPQFVLDLNPSPAFQSGQGLTLEFRAEGVTIFGNTNVNEGDSIEATAGDYSDTVEIFVESTTAPIPS